MTDMLIMCAAGLLSGAAGAMGLGGGGVLMIYLTLFAGVEQIEAQGINLLFFLPCAAVSILMSSREGLIDWKTALPVAGAGLLGALVGYFLSGIIGGEWLGKIFGVYMLVLGAKELLHKKEKST